MNSADLSHFFYNLIPGAIFLLGLYIAGFNPPSSFLGNDGLMILMFILLSLLLGFIFQGVIKLIRERGLNRICFWYVKRRNHRQYVLAKTLINKREIIDTAEHLFYHMDNFLRARSLSANPIHFSSRFAFWSNILVGSYLYLFILSWLDPYTEEILMKITLCVIVFSYVLSAYYFYAYYDVILKTFISLLSSKLLR